MNPAKMPAGAMVFYRKLRSRLRALEDEGITVPCADDRVLEMAGDIWFSEDPKDQAKAVFLCKMCPARPECNNYAVSAREKSGVWGGKSRWKTEEFPPPWSDK